MLTVTSHNEGNHWLVGCVDVEEEEQHGIIITSWDRVTELLGEPENNRIGEYVWWIRAEMTGEHDRVGFFALRVDPEEPDAPDFYLTGDVPDYLVRAVEEYLLNYPIGSSRRKVKLVIGQETKLPFPDRRAA